MKQPSIIFPLGTTILALANFKLIARKHQEHVSIRSDSFETTACLPVKALGDPLYSCISFEE